METNMWQWALWFGEVLSAQFQAFFQLNKYRNSDQKKQKSDLWNHLFGVSDTEKLRFVYRTSPWVGWWRWSDVSGC